MRKNFLKEIRKIKGITAADIAEGTGVSPSLISKYENGRGNLSHDVLDKVTKMLGITRDYILTGKPEINKELVFKASRIAHKYYYDADFSEEKMTSIASSLYDEMIESEEEVKKRSNHKKIIEKLEEDYISGLAKKCYAEHLKSLK